MSLPSKNNIFILSACALALAAVGVAAIYNPQKKTVSDQNKTLSAVNEATPQNTLLNQDSDHDDLKDWEETLWGTDPHNPDTDGDGTPDGEEIKEGRNPLVKGPNDKLKPNELPASLAANIKATTTTPTATDQLAQTLFTTYLTSKKSGQTISTDVETGLIQSAIVSNIQNDIIHLYSQYDFSQSDNSPQSIKEYGNAMGAIFNKNSLPGVENEIVIFGKAFDDQDREAIKKLDTIIATYQKIVIGFTTVKVPPDLIALHVDFVNNFARVTEADKNLRKLFDDPVVALAGLQQYKNAFDAIQSTAAAYGTIFKEKRIVYTPTDSGYTFSQFIGSQ